MSFCYASVFVLDLPQHPDMLAGAWKAGLATVSRKWERLARENDVSFLRCDHSHEKQVMCYPTSVSFISLYSSGESGLHTLRKELVDI